MVTNTSTNPGSATPTVWRRSLADRTRAVAFTTVLAVMLGACTISAGDEAGGSPAAEQGTAALNERAHSPWPAAPPARVCGNDSILGRGPATAPKGAVTVPAGDNRSVDFSRQGATYWFAPGAHTLGPGEYTQIEPGRNSRFVGAPGAVLDGRRVNRYAFGGRASGVTIEYLTIQNFGSIGDNNNEGVVNHDSASNWTIERNTIRRNAGAGLMIGSGNVVRLNCITRNGQYAFNAYSRRGPVGITLDRNELSHNNTYDWEAKIGGCGCTGGGKFWSVTNATVTSNYVHHNKGVGLWADNNNSGFLIENNYVSDNDDVGIFYETSYNALIRRNAILRNGQVGGPDNPGFPVGGIYLSEAGADRRVATRYRHALRVTGNLLRDNWSGVVLWENADRYCGSPANTSTGECTLVNPGVVTVRTCNANNIGREPYYSDCRWKTQNVKVYGNTFEHSGDRVGEGCTYRRGCGLMSIMANFGSYPEWSPYHGRVIEKAITFNQGNTFFDNTYVGSWRFQPFDQSTLKTFAAWRAAPYRQDAGSTLR